MVLAHGDFLHPDAAVLADFLRHGQDAARANACGSGDQHQLGQGKPMPTATPGATSVADIDSSTASLSSAGDATSGGGGDGGRRDGEPVEVEAEGRAGPGGTGGGEGTVVPASSRGTKGRCMVREWNNMQPCTCHQVVLVFICLQTSAIYDLPANNQFQEDCCIHAGPLPWPFHLQSHNLHSAKF